MTGIMTGLSFLLLGLREFGIALSAVLVGVVLVITAILWIVSSAGVAVPTINRQA